MRHGEIHILGEKMPTREVPAMQKFLCYLPLL